MYRIFQKLKRIFTIILYKLFCLIKIDNNKILLYSPSNEKLKGNLLEINKVIENKIVKIYYKNKNIFSFLYDVATSKIIITDDYAPIMYSLKIRKNARFIQVWHASGVFKTVGFKRPTANKKSITHKNYTDVIVSSTNIIDDYSEAFGVDKSNVKALGTIKTDMFFNKETLSNLRKDFEKKYNLNNKKIILYAPTFRGKGIKSAYFNNILDLDKLVNKIDNEYIILFKNHPFVKQKTKFKSKRIIDISNEDNIDYILPFTNLIITDYSSIIFDAALLLKPVIFYVPDLEEYKVNRGFYYEFEEYNFGQITYTIDELVCAIKNIKIDNEKLKKLKEKHLNMCDGNSLERFKNMYLN